MSGVSEERDESPLIDIHIQLIHTQLTVDLLIMFWLRWKSLKDFVFELDENFALNGTARARLQSKYRLCFVSKKIFHLLPFYIHSAVGCIHS